MDSPLHQSINDAINAKADADLALLQHRKNIRDGIQKFDARDFLLMLDRCDAAVDNLRAAISAAHNN